METRGIPMLVRVATTHAGQARLRGAAIEFIVAAVASISPGKVALPIVRMRHLDSPWAISDFESCYRLEKTWFSLSRL
jgi:hypothetical protein